MTRAIAIFLIAVHLMNIVGIYGIIATVEDAHQKKISNELDDEEYAGSEAITLRIPFSLPNSTYVENENYERTHGKIEYEGQVYYMVKHKYHNNMLYIVCVKDDKQTEISGALKNLAASMTDKQDANSSDKTIVISPIKDFEGTYAIELSTALVQLESLRLPEYSFSVIINTLSTPDQPPRV